jgi:hypothetical protein
MMCVLIWTGEAEVFIGTSPVSAYRGGCCGAGRHAAAEPAQKDIFVIFGERLINARGLLMKVI